MSTKVACNAVKETYQSMPNIKQKQNKTEATIATNDIKKGDIEDRIHNPIMQHESSKNTTSATTVTMAKFKLEERRLMLAFYSLLPSAVWLIIKWTKSPRWIKSANERLGNWYISINKDHLITDISGYSQQRLDWSRFGGVSQYLSDIPLNSYLGMTYLSYLMKMYIYSALRFTYKNADLS